MIQGFDRRVRRIALAIGFVLVVVLSSAVVVSNLSISSARSVTVAGSVTDESGAPLDQISVQVYRWANDQWSAITATETDAAGRYRFPGLRPGRLTVAFEDDSGVGYLECWYGGSTAAGSAKSVRLGAGGIGRLDERLVLGGAITGRVTYTKPALGVVGATRFSVVANRLLHSANGAVTGYDTRYAISSLDPTHDGNWRIQYLPTGSYILQVVDNNEDAGPNGEIAPQWIGAGPGTGPFEGATPTNWRQATVFNVTVAQSYRAPVTHVAFASRPPTS